MDGCILSLESSCGLVAATDAKCYHYLLNGIEGYAQHG